MISNRAAGTAKDESVSHPNGADSVFETVEGSSRDVERYE